MSRLAENIVKSAIGVQSEWFAISNSKKYFRGGRGGSVYRGDMLSFLSISEGG